MNTLQITVDDATELLEASWFGAGALIRVEWCATQAGSYAEFATLAIVAGTRFYTAVHAAGTAGT